MYWLGGNYMVCYRKTKEVTLVPNVTPKTDIEKAVFKALSSEGVTSISRLEDYVANWLFQKEISSGAGVTDIGAIGPKAFLEDAIRIIQLLDGKMIVVKKL